MLAALSTEFIRKTRVGWALFLLHLQCLSVARNDFGKLLCVALDSRLSFLERYGERVSPLCPCIPHRPFSRG